MAVVLSNESKYSFAYNIVASAYENTSRTLSGLNIRSGSDVTTGAVPETLIGNLYTTINSFSTGTMGTGRFIVERAVSF